MENRKKLCFEHENCTGDYKRQQYSVIALLGAGFGASVIAGTHASALLALDGNRHCLGAHCTALLGAESSLLKPEHGNFKAAAPRGSPGLAVPKEARNCITLAQQHSPCIRAGLPLAHLLCYREVRGMRASVLQSKACAIGSHWLKSPECYLLIRGAGGSAFCGILRVREVFGRWL